MYTQLPMPSNTAKRFSTLTQAALAGVCFAVVAPTAHSGENFLEALTTGKPSVHLRYRFEQVDQEGFAREAEASTLRTQLGYQTGKFYNFGAFLQFEDVRTIGSERFNSTANGRTQFPVVADPKGNEINQAYLSYHGIPNTTLKFGRQVITYDNHRFVGNVGFRQNEQTYDAFTVENKSLPSTTISFAHVSNVNRFFGEDHPTLSDLHLNGELLNVAYNGFKAGKIVGYSYLLDYDTGQNGNFPVTDSNKTLGLRFDGSSAFQNFKLLYTAEYANQSDYKDGTSRIDADYYYGMLGAEVKGVQVKFNYEVLGGDGVYGFFTPLATLHAHNGWADKFLNTPRDGIRDAWISVGGTAWGVNLIALYHDFSSDNLSYDYGSEFNFLASKKIEKYLTLSVKYADYRGDDNATNGARNGPAVIGLGNALNRDSRKIWLQADLQF